MVERMSIWLAIPSARPIDEVDRTIEQWRMQGYNVALYVNAEREGQPVPAADILMYGKYEGYPRAINDLSRLLLEDTDAQWIICAGDDTLPDQTKTAQEIAAELEAHFNGTLGCCQPTGDRWGENEPWARRMHPARPAYIDRICGSAWYGREFVRRIYQGKYLQWPEYWHMHADQEMQEVAEMLGLLWQRRDLTHHHNHWGKTGNAANMPKFLERANSPEEWRSTKELFDRRKAAGFPGHELLPL